MPDKELEQELLGVSGGESGIRIRLSFEVDVGGGTSETLGRSVESHTGGIAAERGYKPMGTLMRQSLTERIADAVLSAFAEAQRPVMGDVLRQGWEYLKAKMTGRPWPPREEGDPVATVVEAEEVRDIAPTADLFENVDFSEEAEEEAKKDGPKKRPKR